MADLKLTTEQGRRLNARPDTLDFMLDCLDDVLEPIARNLPGKVQWDEMKEDALCEPYHAYDSRAGCLLFF